MQNPKTTSITYTISVKRMSVFAYHGVLPQERIVGAQFYVSLEAETEVTSEAYFDDNLNGTVNYAKLCEVVKQEMSVPSQLLERVAKRICDSVLAHFPSVQRIHVFIEKENPPLGIQSQSIGVKLVQARERGN